MSFLHFIKLLSRNWKLLVLIPLALAASVFYFTRHQKKTFSSETDIYTGIASGYTLNGSNKADYFETSNAFDNLLSLINSRETKQEVVLRLLAEHLSLPKHDPNVLSWGAYEDLQKLVPTSVKRQLVKSTVEETYAAIEHYLQSSDNNIIYTIINSDNPFYSINTLQNANAIRINSSDLIKISYSTDDAAICKRTLELLEETFMRKHKMLRTGQTESVIAFFESETKKSFQRLDSAEQSFLDFNRNNDIINYYEQTKAVAGAKEDLFALNHTLEMDRMANQDALGKIDKDLAERAKQSLYGGKVIDQRQQLSDIYNKIALYETFSTGGSDANKAAVDSLTRVAKSIEKNLRTSVDDLYAVNTTPEGIPSNEMLDQWVKTTVNYEQSKARLQVMDKRKKEFEVEYRKFAPLGAMLQKIERQISVAEQEYLEMLHGLNLARLAQQNNELTSKLTIVDPPYLPLKPNRSLRAIIVAVSFIAGFIIVLGVLLAQMLVNQTVLEPTRGTKKLGIPLAAVFPLLNENKAVIKKASLRLLQQLLATINTNKRPLVIGFISVQNKEGKTELISRLRKGMDAAHCSTEYLQWNNDRSFTPSADSITFIEFPSLDEYIYTNADIPHLDHVFLVCRANRVWGKIDKELLNNFIKTTNTEPKAILNGVVLDFAEEYIGEVPRKRSFFRTSLKRFAKFEFGNRTVIAKRKREAVGV
jgi:hypothetical protein